MILRHRTADFLKGIAILLMIQVHLMELFAKQEIYNGVLGKISLFLGGPPAAPVFMAVMGYFLFFSNKGLYFSSLRGLKLIIWGFALNTGLNLNLFYQIYIGALQLSPYEYIFGVDILFLAGLSVIFIALLKRLFKRNTWAYILVLIIVLLIPEFFNPPINQGFGKYLWAYFYSNQWWAYFPMVPWFAYVLLGYIFSLEKDRLLVHISKNKLTVFLGSIALVFLGLVYDLDVSSKLEEYYHHGLLYFLFTLVFIIFWSLSSQEFVNKFNNKFTNYIEWLGKNVTRAYVFQWLIIGNIATNIYKTQNELQLLLWLTGIIIVVSVLVFLWGLIKDKRAKIKTE